LTTQRERELINKVPILGDIPLLGWLFKSKFTRTEKQHVLFAISPRILQHSDFETEF
jgi:general secretion pathway protein D